MKKYIGLVLLLLLPAMALAQGVPGAYVQQTGSMLNAATQCATNVTSATTTTITPPAGNYVYITEIDIANCAGGTAVTAAAVTSLTTTGITGSPVWTIGSGVAAGLCQPTVNTSLPTGLKSSSPGTAITFVMPTFATNQTVRLNVCYYVAP